MSSITWNGPPNEVVGVGPNPAPYLSSNRMHLLRSADLIVGAQRHLDGVGDVAAQTLIYPSPLDGLEALLRDASGKRVVILASGDPLLFGIGAWLKERLSPQFLRFHPNVSAIQSAFGAVGIPWQDAKIVSLHGRPLRRLLPVLRANRLYAVLTDADNHPAAIASLLDEYGFGESTVWVAEDLGAASERVRAFSVRDLLSAGAEFSPLNVVVLETRGPGGVLPEFPGIPDTQFSTDRPPGQGMLSKREVRLNAISLLQPRAHEIGWDVGAGCGGISIEWAFWSPRSKIHAVEKHPGRLEHLRFNRDRFGVVENVEVIAGEAPAVLCSLPDPDAIFIGGSEGQLTDMLQYAWSRLRHGGRLVAAAVTEESRAALVGFAPVGSPELTELRVARGESLGGQKILRPLLPVLLARLTKS